MTGVDPTFTVIMATWGRGRHILPSIRSVLDQDERDFELLVIGDACTDDTGAVVQGIADPRLRWMNLAERWKTQSGPNNAGIAVARGRFIAYLGHDDVWHPTHLAQVRAVFDRDLAADFVVAGCIMHPPQATAAPTVTGLDFRDGANPGQFFPPSSFAHRRDLTDRIGPWCHPSEARVPVDADLLQRAAELRFVATRAATVHKFAANHRYLDYLVSSDVEQTAILACMHQSDYAARLQGWIAAATEAGSRSMALMQRRKLKGAIWRRSLAQRGAAAVPLTKLRGPTVLRHRRETSAKNWHKLPLFGLRRTKASANPRLLVPFTGGQAKVAMMLWHPDPAALGELAYRCNGDPAERATPGPSRRGLWGYRAEVVLPMTLRSDRASVLELCLDPLQAPAKGRRGLWVGPLRLAPV